MSAYLIAIGALLTHEYQLILFLRSIDNPLLEDMGRVGNGLGHGVTLIMLCLFLLACGLLTAHQTALRAGLHGLIAHALAGALVQIIKHTVGRPRPRYAHQEIWQWGPSLEGGFDAFPSGHSTASFAVATVLAWHFPRWKWVWYSSAIFVAWSRVVKGSHFPSDVLTGALIGYLVGCLVTQGIRQWRTVLPRSIVQAVLVFVIGWVLVWIPFETPKPDLMATLLIGTGGLAILASLWWETRVYVQGGLPLHPPTIGSNLLAGFGLACSTASFLVVVVAMLALVSYALWHSGRDIRSAVPQAIPPRPRLSHEWNSTIEPRSRASRSPIVISYGAWCVSLIGMYLILYELRGLVPLF